MKTFLLKLKNLWIKFGDILLYINTRIILFLLYFLVLPVIALPYKFILLFKKTSDSSWEKPEVDFNIKEQF